MLGPAGEPQGKKKEKKKKVALLNLNVQNSRRHKSNQIARRNIVQRNFKLNSYNNRLYSFTEVTVKHIYY